MSNQTLHDVVIAPGGSCQQRGFSLPVLDIHIAANFTEGLGHGVITMPGSTVQGGFFFLLKDTVQRKNMQMAVASRPWRTEAAVNGAITTPEGAAGVRRQTQGSPWSVCPLARSAK